MDWDEVGDLRRPLRREGIDMIGHPNLKLWLPMSETSGTSVVDASGNGYSGTLQGTTARVSGVAGNGLDFNAAGRYVQTPFIYNANPLTIAFWMKRIGTCSGVYVCFVGRTYDVQFDFSVTVNGGGGGFTADRVGFSWFSAGSDGRAGGGVIHGIEITSLISSFAPVDTWTHIAATRGATGTPTSSTFYVNGQIVPVTLYGTGAPVGNKTVQTPIGGSSTGYNFPGVMDDVQIYNTTLPASDIKRIMLGKHPLTRS